MLLLSEMTLYLSTQDSAVVLQIFHGVKNAKRNKCASVYMQEKPQSRACDHMTQLSHHVGYCR